MAKLGFQLLNAGPLATSDGCRTGSYPELLETIERLAGEVWLKLEGHRA
ncbi:MAG: hypothetical protein ACE5JN_01815 [Candidatus Methylomirabilia bacterium]